MTTRDNGDNRRHYVQRASWALKRAAARQFRRTPLGQAITVAKYARRAISTIATPRAASQAIAKAVGGGSVNQLISALKSQDPQRAWSFVERYALSGDPQYQAIRQLLAALGPVGALLGALVPGGTSGRPGVTRSAGVDDSLRAALEFVSAFSDRPEVLSTLTRILEGQGAKVIWPGQEPAKALQPTVPMIPGRPPVKGTVHLPDELSQALGDLAQGGTGQGTGGTGLGAGHGGGWSSLSSGGTTRVPTAGPAMPGPAQGAAANGTTAELFEDGQSFRLPKDHPAVTGDFIETPQSSNVHSFGFDHDSHTLFVRFKARAEGDGKRPHKPGAIYSYRNVPLSIFLRMLTAPSKGVFIWDNIRIRGTLSGHRYDYALVGVQDGYVPRKATLTPQGESYISRSVFTDQGRRLSSSLPDQLVRPLVPGRQPNSGRNGLSGG